MLDLTNRELVLHVPLGLLTYYDPCCIVSALSCRSAKIP